MDNYQTSLMANALYVAEIGCINGLVWIIKNQWDGNLFAYMTESEFKKAYLTKNRFTKYVNNWIYILPIEFALEKMTNNLPENFND